MLAQARQDLQQPLQQILQMNQPVLNQQHVLALQRFGNRAADLDALIQELQYSYIHDASQVYLALLYLLTDYLGAAVITRQTFKGFCRNINQISFNEKSAQFGILLSQLVTTKLSPLDQDIKSPELTEIFEMSSRALVVTELGKHGLQMRQQAFDCFYVSQVLIIKELVTQLFELEDPPQDEQTLQSLGNSNGNTNQYLKLLHQQGNQTFKLFQLPDLARCPESEKDERKLQIYGLLVENQIEVQQFKSVNNLTSAACEVLAEQEDIIQQLILNIKENNQHLKNMFSLQRMESKMMSTKKVQAAVQHIPLAQRSSFFMFEDLTQDEDQMHEYKNYRWPLTDPLRIETLQQVVCSFINTKGGYLFLGIKDQNKQVVGIRLSGKERDELKLLILSLGEKINPQVDMFHNPAVTISFLPIKNKNSLVIAGIFVVRITVQPGLGDRFYTYLNNQREVVGILRMDGRKKVVAYPDVMERVYQSLKNPRERQVQLEPAVPELIVDTGSQQDPNQESNYLQKIKKFSQSPRFNRNLQINRPFEKREMSIEYNDQYQIHQTLPSGPYNEKNLINRPQVPEDPKTFSVILYSEMTNDQIQHVITQVLGDMARNPTIRIELLSQQEFEIKLQNQQQVEQLQGKIWKSTQHLKTLQVIRSIKLGQKTLFDFPPQLLENVKKQQQTELLVFGFIKMDYTQKANLLNQVNRMLQEIQVTTAFVHPYENSILIGFNGQHNLEQFVYTILSQHLHYKKFGYQQNLMGGKVSKKITYKGIPNEVVDTIATYFQIEVGTNQDGSGFLMCQSEEDAAKIFDYLLIQKNRLKKSSGPNKLEVLWQLETLLVNIK